MTGSDAELVARCATRGDTRAFEELYDRHSSLVFSLALAMTRSREKAEDVTQDAFLALWRSASRFDPARASARTWLVAITRNVAIDHGRRVAAEERANRVWLAREPEPDTDPVPDEALAGAAARDLRRALHELPDAQRDALERAFLAHRPHRRIAADLGVPVGTVKGRVRLGLARLRGSLSHWGTEDGLPI